MTERSVLCARPIVHVVQSMRMGGIETLVWDLMKAGRGDQRCLSLEGPKERLLDAWPELASVADHLTVLDKLEGVDFSLVRRIVRELRRLKPRAVVLHHIGPLLYGSIAARIARIPVVLHYEHDVWHYEDPKHRRLLRGLSVAMRPRHIATSNNAADRMAQILPSAPVVVVPPGIDLDRFVPGDRRAAQSRLGLGDCQHWIGTVGRLVPVKDQVTMVRCLKQLPPSIGAVIVGDGPERDVILGEAVALGVGDRLRLLGQRRDVPEILPAFDVFCLPSRHEGMPRSLMEAQACGVPVVASDVGAIREVVCESTGRLAAPGDVEAFSQAIRSTIARGPVAEPTRRHVAQRFSLAAVLEALDRLTVPHGSTASAGLAASQARE